VSSLSAPAALSNPALPSPALPSPVVLSGAVARLWLIGAAAAALALYYFIGVDQGAYSVFGQDLHLHEFVHDGRHFLGFPCH
jgi:hypothetical protein